MKSVRRKRCTFDSAAATSAPCRPSHDDQRRARGTRRANRCCSASSAVSALNVVPCGGSVAGHAPREVRPELARAHKEQSATETQRHGGSLCLRVSVADSLCALGIRTLRAGRGGGG